MFKIIILAIPNLYIAPLGLATLSKMVDNIGGGISGQSSNLYGKVKSRLHAFRKNQMTRLTRVAVRIDRSLSVESVFLRNLEKQMKKPVELDNVDLNSIFRGLQEVDINDPPITIVFPEVNPNPKNIQKNELVNKFNIVLKGRQVFLI